MAEGARLESVYTGNRIVGSNPTLSAIESGACRSPESVSAKTDEFRREVISAHVVHDTHVEGGCRRTLLNVATHMESLWIGPVVNQFVDYVGVTVKREDHLCIVSKNGAEAVVFQPMRMISSALNGKQIDDVCHTNAQLGSLPTQPPRGRDGFARGHVASGDEHHVRLFVIRDVACPGPSGGTCCTMQLRCLYAQPLLASSMPQSG